ncbi:hypothetical protein JKP88DRAFT_284559 [Tribonema minus]|uniref:SF3 helicase domain-containing protein n=1 Tax=Tribonema minus TaxID=303371 RepID=A0A835ZP59_9STRA|nr:hypothetical protein JKP88DRAFT_284559 [Tribonema minus]
MNGATGLAAAADDEPADNAAAAQELHEMEQDWGTAWGAADGVDAKLRALYGWGTAAFRPDQALATFEDGAQSAVQLVAWAEETGQPDLRARAERVIRCVHESYTCLVAASSWQGDNVATMHSAEDILIRFATPLDTKPTNMQTLFRFALTWTRRLKLRHRGDVVYREIVANGRRTRAWVPAVNVNGVDISTLELVCANIFTRRHSNSMWMMFLTVGTNAIVEKLRICIEADFPVVRTTREWLSFSDGLYNVLGDLFVYFDDPRFELPEDLAACAYHGMPFAPHFVRVQRQQGGPIPEGLPLHPFTEVSTPILDTIFETQKFCGHTRFWLMALMGRMLYWSGTLDTWQVVPFLKGKAGTGKSTLVNFMAAIYSSNDVCIIGNDVQGTFGLETLDQDKLIWVAPEVRGTFTLDQGQFQSLVSNEEMMVAQKNKKARQGSIKCTGMMAGNSLPENYLDNSGSAQRRLPIFNFSVKVTRTRTDLLAKMRTMELPAILRKINHAYQTAAVMLGGKDLWSSGLLSKHVVKENQMLASTMNPLRNFMSRAEIEKRAEAWCPEHVFQAAFKDCNNVKESQWTPDYYDTPFGDFGVIVRRAMYRWDGGNVTQGTVVWGCCAVVDLDKMGGGEGENPQFPDPLDTDTNFWRIPPDIFNEMETD